MDRMTYLTMLTIATPPPQNNEEAYELLVASMFMATMADSYLRNHSVNVEKETISADIKALNEELKSKTAHIRQ